MRACSKASRARDSSQLFRRQQDVGSEGENPVCPPWLTSHATSIRSRGFDSKPSNGSISSTTSRVPLKPDSGQEYSLANLSTPTTPHTGNMVPIEEEEIQTPNTSTQFLNPAPKVQLYRITETVVSWDHDLESVPHTLRVSDREEPPVERK